MTTTTTQRPATAEVGASAMRITRIDVPEWVREPHSAYSRGQRGSSVERQEWGWVIPLMFRVLADPTAGLPMPATPEPADTLAELGYFTALTHLCAYLLGWRDIAKGLQWWLDNDAPRFAAALQLLAEVWHADDTIARFLPWTDAICAAISSQPAAPDAPDPLMLAGHVRGPLDPDIRSVRWYGNVMIRDAMPGWYRELECSGSRDQVSIFVTTVGYLGNFHRSPTTGLWMTVDEATHLAGN